VRPCNPTRARWIGFEKAAITSRRATLARMIAFLGLGLLGANFVRALAKRGETIHVWNRSPDKARALAAEAPSQIVAFAEVADAVRGASRVHVTVSDDAAVDGVLARVLPALAPDAVIIDHSTTSPHGTAARAAGFASQKIAFQHAPVFMGPQNALASTGIMLASGPASRFEALSPELSKMTGKLVYLGEDPARAAAFKLLGNLFLVEMIASLSDVLALAKASGIEGSEVGKLFEFFNPAALLPVRLAKLLEAQFDAPSWTLEMARKDVRLMLETAARGEVALRQV
jgi:3-hydroxyisobutyrate dehydrogenase